jgi:hypothetical protein
MSGRCNNRLWSMKIASDATTTAPTTVAFLVDWNYKTTHTRQASYLNVVQTYIRVQMLWLATLTANKLTRCLGSLKQKRKPAYVQVNKWLLNVPDAGLRRRSAAARLLRLRVRIPPVAWMSVCCECCVLSGRGLCNELITHPGESYRLWCVVVCDLETSWMRRP